ncbi:MAG: class I SAM-dependent methyltransferase [Planctomycetota bacterium]|nr:class I SAM-dependent methyltransferase [Planctomycetota bacterium]
MGNPWTDPEKARNWEPTGKPGQVHREHALGVVFALLDVHAPRRILDLGCGIGDVDARLLERFPDATLVGIDASAGMLERAAEALAPYEGRVTLRCKDLDESWESEVGGPFDAVLASQAVHHLEDVSKQALFWRVHALLVPGGIFILNDRVQVEPAFFPHHVALWNRDRAEHGFEPCPAGVTHETWTAREREGGDLPDRLGDQLYWLREAGFAVADALWRQGNQAVFAALKAPAESA